MGMLGGLLTKRALLLAKVETTVGVDANPTPALNAITVQEPSATADPTVLERDFVANDLSPFEFTVGRVVGGIEFQTYVGGNGTQHSGLLADAPMLATLMQGCGMALTGLTGTAALNVFPVIADKKNPATSPSIEWAVAGTLDVSITAPVLYTVEVTTGGASGVAEVLITNNNDGIDDLTAATDKVITTATALTVGGSGFTITPTFTGSLTVGQRWYVMVFPKGVKVAPISDNFKTLTLYLYRDGLLFKVLASMGTFTMTAAAGELASLTFNFSGQWVPPVDAAMPDDAVFPETLPPMVELAQLTWGNNVNLTTQQFTLDMANEVVQRPDVNSQYGYAGSRISSRAPTGGFNPEATLEADEPFWDDFTKARAKIFTARVGTEAGNQCIIFGPRVQTSDQSTDDRDGLMFYDKSIAFKRFNGNDELLFVFA